MNPTARRVAVLGGSRIPFARQNGPYAKASNQDMLTTTLDALVARFGLEGEVLGEVAAGAVLKHSRDFNLTRESVLGSQLAPATPAYDVQQACGTGLEATIARRQQDRARSDRLRHRRRRRHHLRRADRRQRGPARGAARRSTGPSPTPPGCAPWRGCAPSRSSPRSPATPSRAPGCRWASTPRSWPASGGSAARPRTSWRSPATITSPPPTTPAGWTISSPRSSASSATRTSARTRASRSWPSSSRCSADPEGTMTAGNSTPLSDGASTVLLASEEWASAHRIPVQAYFVDAQTAGRRLRPRAARGC